MLLIAGAALAAGCIHREVPARSPFITPLPEGGRPEDAASYGTADGRSAGDETLSADSAAALARAERSGLQEVEGPHGAALVRPSQRAPGESPEIVVERERAAVSPGDVAAQLSLARTYHRAGIHDLALDHYEKARRLSPADPEITLELARLWVDAGSPEAALPLLDQVVAARPNDASAWNVRGIALDLLERWAEGEAALRRAAELDPGRWDHRNNLGYNLLLQDRYAEAAAEFERGLALAPSEPALANNLGLALGLAGRPEAAFAMFLRGGREAQAWNNLGVVHRSRGELAAAADAFAKAWRLDPSARAIGANYRESRRLLAERAQADSARAGAAADSALARAPADPALAQAPADSVSPATPSDSVLVQEPADSASRAVPFATPAAPSAAPREAQPARVGARAPRPSPSSESKP